MGLESHFEVVKLTRELRARPGTLDGLEGLPADRIRRLRRLAGDALHDSHRQAFERAAAASALLPSALTARLAQTLVGPYLSARIAAEMTPARSIRLASHLDVGFLADVCLSLDPSRVADTVRGLPDDQVVAVGLELLGRGEHVTLGKFVDVVAPAVVDAVADRIDDPLALLHIGTAIEARHRLDELVARMGDGQLAALVRAAADHAEMASAVSLMSHLGDDNRQRLSILTVDAGEDVVDAVVRTAHAEHAWSDVLPVLTSVDADRLARAVNVPATRDPDVLRSAILAAEDAGLWDELLPLVVHLDDERVAVLGSMPDLLTPPRLARLVAAALPRQPMWAPLVDTLGRLPEDQQRGLAVRLLADDDFDVAAFLGLLDLVPSAADLTLVATLRAAAEDD